MPTSTLLRNLAHRSDLPNRKVIMSLLSKIQNESKRNVFAHAFITSDPNTVTFVDRSRGGDYKVTSHRYTLREFVEHVEVFAKAASGLEIELGLDRQELSKFAATSFSAETVSPKSPTRAG